ncbi:MAG: hypothetical protein ICV73_00880, partial [Acetobacteraceae bacterium]|nr:hypothetical protein [Acetobacteraceae bacterium]
MTAATARAPPRAGAAPDRTPTRPDTERALLAAWLDRRLLAALLRDGLVPAGGDSQPVIDLPGLSVSAEAVHALLRPPGGDSDPARLEAEAEAAWRRLFTTGDGVLARLSGSGLDGAALRVLALCLAPDLDGRYAKVYGFLHDDVTRRRASLPLLRQVMRDEGVAVGRALSATAPLRRLGLLQAAEGEPAGALASLEADPVVLCALERDLPGDLADLVRRAGWREREPAGAAVGEDLAAAARALAGPFDAPRLLRVQGEQRPERRVWAEA